MLEFNFSYSKNGCKLLYLKCPKLSNTLFHTFLVYSLLFMQLFFKTLSRMANSIDPDLGLLCIGHFVKNFGVRNFRTFTVSEKKINMVCNLEAGFQEVLLVQNF